MWASIALTVCSIYNVVNNFSLLLLNPLLLSPLLLNPLLLNPLLLGALFALTMFKVTTWLMLVCFSQYASAGCLICPNLCSKLPRGYSFSSFNPLLLGASFALTVCSSYHVCNNFSLLLLGTSFALTICSTGSPRCMLQSATLSFVIAM